MDSELSWSVLAGFHRQKDPYGSLLIEKKIMKDKFSCLHCLVLSLVILLISKFFNLILCWLFLSFPFSLPVSTIVS